MSEAKDFVTSHPPTNGPKPALFSAGQRVHLIAVPENDVACEEGVILAYDWSGPEDDGGYMYVVEVEQVYAENDADDQLRELGEEQIVLMAADAVKLAPCDPLYQSAYDHYIFDLARDIAYESKSDPAVLKKALQELNATEEEISDAITALNDPDGEEEEYRGKMVNIAVVECVKDALRYFYGFNRRLSTQLPSDLPEHRVKDWFRDCCYERK